MRFTKTAIEKLDAPLKDTFIWDDDMKGFGVRLSPKGSKSYLVQYRARNRTRRQSLGSFCRITLDDARRQAKVILGKVASGRDPGASREMLTTSHTLREVAEIFLNEHVNLKLKATTKRQYNQVISQYVLPNLGDYKICEISRGDIAKLQLDLQSIPAQANCVIRVLSRLFSFAEQREFTNGKPNPCQHIELYEEKKRNRYLDEIELKRLWETLEHVEREGSVSSYAVNAYRLLILTGCRLSEVRTMKWEFLRGRHVELPDTKTGYRRIPLNDAALRVIRGLIRQEDNEYMFCGNVEEQPIVNLQKSWRRIRVKAGLDDVRIHDLRHTFASQAVMKGMPLALVSRLLGHSKITTTMRYAHLADKELAEATNQIGKMLDFSKEAT